MGIVTMAAKEEEQARWQARIVEVIRSAGLEPRDASGNESGDPLDFTADQVTMALHDVEERTVSRICAWMRAARTPHAQANAIERGDWRSPPLKVAVDRVDMSAINTKRWCLTLACGHELWVTASRRPTTKKVHCGSCETLRGARERAEPK